jgi:hypothetical protein
MSAWDFRQAIESAIPLWLYGVVFVVALVLLAYGALRGRGK